MDEINSSLYDKARDHNYPDLYVIAITVLPFYSSKLRVMYHPSNVTGINKGIGQTGEMTLITKSFLLLTFSPAVTVNS